MLFRDPSKLAEFYPGKTKQIETLQAIRDAHDSPERINDDPMTAPSKRIQAQFPSYKGQKPVFGPTRAKVIGLYSLRGQMPHFDAWLASLEAPPPSPDWPLHRREYFLSWRC